MIHILLWHPVCCLLPRAFPSLSAGARLALPSAAAAPGCKSCYLTSCCALPLPLPSQYGACGGGGGLSTVHWGNQLHVASLPSFLIFVFPYFLLHLLSPFIPPSSFISRLLSFLLFLFIFCSHPCSFFLQKGTPFFCYMQPLVFDTKMKRRIVFSATCNRTLFFFIYIVNAKRK